MGSFKQHALVKYSALVLRSAATMRLGKLFSKRATGLYVEPIALAITLPDIHNYNRNIKHNNETQNESEESSTRQL